MISAPKKKKSHIKMAVITWTKNEIKIIHFILSYLFSLKNFGIKNFMLSLIQKSLKTISNESKAIIQ
jgi:hypothetical protein